MALIPTTMLYRAYNETLNMPASCVNPRLNYWTATTRPSSIALRILRGGFGLDEDEIDELKRKRTTARWFGNLSMSTAITFAPFDVTALEDAGMRRQYA